MEEYYRDNHIFWKMQDNTIIEFNPILPHPTPTPTPTPTNSNIVLERTFQAITDFISETRGKISHEIMENLEILVEKVKITNENYSRDLHFYNGANKAYETCKANKSNKSSQTNNEIYSYAETQVSMGTQLVNSSLDAYNAYIELKNALESIEKTNIFVDKIANGELIIGTRFYTAKAKKAVGETILYTIISYRRYIDSICDNNIVGMEMTTEPSSVSTSSSTSISIYNDYKSIHKTTKEACKASNTANDAMIELENALVLETKLFDFSTNIDIIFDNAEIAYTNADIAKNILEKQI